MLIQGRGAWGRREEGGISESLAKLTFPFRARLSCNALAKVTRVYSREPLTLTTLSPSAKDSRLSLRRITSIVFINASESVRDHLFVFARHGAAAESIKGPRLSLCFVSSADHQSRGRGDPQPHGARACLAHASRMPTPYSAGPDGNSLNIFAHAPKMYVSFS